MSPKFYTYLWIAFFAGWIVVFLAGAFTMLAGVVFGFVAFGLIFAGMMCVLPAQVAHPHPATSEGVDTRKKTATEEKVKTVPVGLIHAQIK